MTIPSVSAVTSAHKSCGNSTLTHRTTTDPESSTSHVGNGTEATNSDIEQILSTDSYHNNNNDNVVDEFYTNGDTQSSEDNTRQQRKLNHWKDSPFAVGLVNITWWDDRPLWFLRSKDDQLSHDDVDTSIPVSAIVCGCIGANRVGNMAILAQSTETYTERIEDTNGQLILQTKTRPKLLWVIGPYWTVNFFITFPLIIGVSGWVCYRRVSRTHIGIIIPWTIGTFLLLFSLCMISCRNPGILHRHTQPPSSEDTEGEEWRWNDQAKTYRPSKARFDPETQVVVEGFDHTCPWTGTAIGSRNMIWFRIFITMVPVMIGFNVILSASSFFF